MIRDLVASVGNHTDDRWDVDWPVSPIWVISIAIMMLVGFAGLQWWRRQSSWKLAWRKGIFLWSLRTLVVVMICWMIGRWHKDRYETVPSDLVVLLDSSESMQLSASQQEREKLNRGMGDSLTRWEALQQWLTVNEAETLRELAENFRLRVSSIAGEQNPIVGDAPAMSQAILQREAVGPQSKIGDHLIAIARAQRGRSTAAILVLTDGQVTEGASLEEAAEEIAALRLPVYTFPVGSRDPEPQVSVTEVIADSTAMVGDVVEVIVRWSWTGESEIPMGIRLVDAITGEQLDQASVERSAAEGTGTSNLRFVADDSGIRRLKVEIDEVPGEWNLADNHREFMVEVRDDQFRVLLVQGGASYEFRFLKHLLERATTRDGNEPLVDLITVLQRGDAGYADQDRSAVRLPPVDDVTLEKLDLVVLSDCSPSGLGTLFQEKIVDLVTRVGISLVILSGPEHLPSELSETPLERLLPIDPRGVLVRPSQTAFRWQLAPLGRTIKSFNIDGSFDWWDRAPGVYAVAPVSRIRPAARVLAEVTSEAGSDNAMPVILSQFVGAGQVWLHLTDETFRFRGADRAASGYEQFWLQLVRGLAQRRAVLADDEAVVEVDGDTFALGNPVDFQIQLGGALAIQANNKVEAMLFGPDGNQQSVTAELDIGGRGRFLGTLAGLPPGDYRIVLTQPLGGGPPPSDVFQIVERNQERSAVEVDIEGLTGLANQTGGAVFDLGDDVAELIAALPKGEVIEINATDSRPYWNHPLVALVLFSLLAAEWIGRRLWGGA